MADKTVEISIFISETGTFLSLISPHECAYEHEVAMQVAEWCMSNWV